MTEKTIQCYLISISRKLPKFIQCQVCFLNKKSFFSSDKKTRTINWGFVMDIFCNCVKVVTPACCNAAKKTVFSVCSPNEKSYFLIFLSNNFWCTYPSFFFRDARTSVNLVEKCFVQFFTL